MHLQYEKAWGVVEEGVLDLLLLSEWVLDQSNRESINCL